MKPRRSVIRHAEYRFLCTDCEAWDDRPSIHQIRVLADAHAEDESHIVTIVRLVEIIEPHHAATD
jgi:hypothetical protein